MLNHSRKHKSSASQSGNSLTAQLDIIIMNENDTYVAYCPALDLSSYGKTPAAAHKAFSEALEIFIEETLAKGTFEKELLRLGWTLTKASYMPPQVPIDLYDSFFQQSPKMIHEREKMMIPA